MPQIILIGFFSSLGAENQVCLDHTPPLVAGTFTAHQRTTCPSFPTYAGFLTTMGQLRLLLTKQQRAGGLNNRCAFLTTL